MPNKEQTRAFDELAGRATAFIMKLPWTGTAIGLAYDKAGPFENDKFVRPNFVGLDLLCYYVSNVWTGLTAPGYTDVAEVHGRKNLTFSNRVYATNPDAKIPFVQEQDITLFKELKPDCFFLQLAGHELIGHGCGKLLQETEPSKFNFDKQNLPVSPLTKQPITTWYKVGETPMSVFGGIATAYVECLAEGIGLYLMSEESLVRTLRPHLVARLDDVVYIGYLSIITIGLRVLGTYDASKKKWGQVHDQARFGLVKCLHNARGGLLGIRFIPGSTPDLTIHLDRSKIDSIGRPALQELILKLHIYRCTADVGPGSALFEELTAVDGEYQQWREAVLAHREPRSLFIQANTFLEGDNVVLREYPMTKEGLVQSWVDRE